jgi:uncharacterized membrane protein YfcA
MSWQWPAGAACGFVIALITTPAGVSGAVLLLPVQLSVLNVPSLAVTPTNLVFNVVAVPGGLLGFWRERRLFNSLSALLIAGTLPGVILGAIMWILGVAMGLGGFAGSYAGAHLQSRLPEMSLRRLLDLIACLVAARYTQTAFEGTPGRVPAHATSR